MMLQYFLFIGHANNHSLQKRSQSARKQLLEFSARKRTICHRFLGRAPVRTREYEESLTDSKTPSSAVLNYRWKGNVFFLKVQIFKCSNVYKCYYHWRYYGDLRSQIFQIHDQLRHQKRPPEDIVSGRKVAETWTTRSFQSDMAALAYSMCYMAVFLTGCSMSVVCAPQQNHLGFSRSCLTTFTGKQRSGNKLC